MSNNFQLKHDEGGTMDMIQILIGILALVFLLMINISFTSTADKRSRIELVEHEYILRMETEGCLTAEAKQMLNETLTDMGMQDIVVLGTASPVDYGQRITIVIRGNLVTTAYGMSDRNFSLFKGETKIPVDITKTSISRYVK